MACFSQARVILRIFVMISKYIISFRFNPELWMTDRLTSLEARLPVLLELCWFD